MDEYLDNGWLAFNDILTFDVSEEVEVDKYNIGGLGFQQESLVSSLIPAFTENNAKVDVVRKALAQIGIYED